MAEVEASKRNLFFARGKKKKIHLPALGFPSKSSEWYPIPAEKKGSVQSRCQIYGTHPIQPLNTDMKSKGKLWSQRILACRI